MVKDFDLSQLTEEQQALIQEFLYKNYAAKNVDDTSQFVVPFIAMNDGRTPAQVKAISKGIYKDVQRNPFLRKTGVFNENNAIEDIDITPLVYYGSLQQAKIAPTLENIDIKLYYREPKLNRVPSPETEYGTPADTYIWRELPVGFHVFNNDTVYGYEWLVLQDNYSGTDGVYNLHMNVENGLGACKFAGTQAPINLAGVQYKIVITAKNLWNREFSLLDSMPLLKSLKSESNELAPTVNAIKRYYEEAVHTLEVITESLFVPAAEDSMLFANKEGVKIKILKLGEIENLQEYVNAIRDEFDTHASEAIDGAMYDNTTANSISSKDFKQKLKGPHGIVNKGAQGNIDAKTLKGLDVSNGQQALSNNDTDKDHYIPYVGSENSIGIGTEVKYYKKASGSSPEPIYTRKFVTPSESNSKLLEIQDISNASQVGELLHTISVGSLKFEAKLSSDSSNGATLELKANKTSQDKLTLHVKDILTDGISFENESLKLDKDWINYQSGTSSIAYKIPISELLNINLKQSELGKILSPNSSTDADGNTVENLDTTSLDDQSLQVTAKDFSEDGKHFADVTDVNESEKAFDKLGSALQALYELPLGTYTYKRGQESYKEQLGIFVERVNQVRDNLKKLRGKGEKDNGLPSEDNYLVHKRVKSIQSDNDKIVDYNKGYNSTKDSGDQGSEFKNRVENNAYTYTDDEIKSIAHYLDLMTSKKELAQEIRNTVGILLKAAKETQERLLDVETNIYGFDARTIPGSDEARQTFVDNHIDEKLQSVLNNSPLLLGLNRLMRAICLELYDTTDLEKIDAEIRSVVGDSDSLQQKVTAKSRMDQVDDILSDLINQASAITRYYAENVLSDESQHTYVDIYQKDDKQRITEKASIREDRTLLDNVKDDHTETKDIDKDRTWKNLPAADDVKDEEKNKVGFAQVAEFAHKHTPNKAESGIVRIPEVKRYKHTDYDAEGKPTERVWREFVLDKDEETGTYRPVFKTKAVAWDTAKLERVNKKLSEVTKTIYGVDDVTASLPNRTEVLRRNITNLVDDLYPNRIFDVEKKITIEGDETADIRLPFKHSRVQLTTDQTKRAALQGDETDKGVEHHTSIIPHINNELFNFSFTNNIFKNAGTGNTAFSSSRKYELLDSPIDYKNNKQITVDIEETGNISFSTRSLVTDKVELSNITEATFGTYFNNYSKLDLLENLIGIEDCFPTNLFKTTIYDALGIDSNNLGVLDFPAKRQSNYKKQEEADETVEEAKLQQSMLQTQQEELEEEIRNLEDKVSDLSSEIANLQVNVDNLTTAYEAKKAEEVKIVAQLNEANNKTFDTTTVQTQISNLNSEINVLKGNLKNGSSEQLENELEAKEIALTDKEVNLKNLKVAKIANADLINRLNVQLDAAQKDTAAVLTRRDSHYKQLRASQKELEDTKSAIAALSSSLVIAKVNYANYQTIADEAQVVVEEEAVDINLLPSYTKELAYPDSKKIIQNNGSDTTKAANKALEESSNLDFVLSRKQKSIQSRITTLEAFADTLTKGLNRVDQVFKTSLVLRPTTELEANTRFEAHDAVETFRNISETTAAIKSAEHLVFDLDLSESFVEKKEDTNRTGSEEQQLVDTFKHNRDVFKVIANSKDVKKTPYKLATNGEKLKYKASYTITGTLESSLDYMWFEEDNTKIREKYVIGNSWTVTVKYITAASMVDKEDTTNVLSQLNNGYYHTIYLQHKEVTKDLQYMYNTESNNDAQIDKVLTNSQGWQNQTEYNIYKMVSDMFTSLFTKPSNIQTIGTNNSTESEDSKANCKNSLYYQMMLIAHPIGSIYMSLDNKSPQELFGGNWIKMEGKFMLPTVEADPTLIEGYSPKTESYTDIKLDMLNVNVSTTLQGTIDHNKHTGGSVTEITDNLKLNNIEVNASSTVNGTASVDVQLVYAWYRTA